MFDILRLSGILYTSSCAGIHPKASAMFVIETNASYVGRRIVLSASMKALTRTLSTVGATSNPLLIFTLDAL